MILFSIESFVFQFAIPKYKDYDTQNYNFAVVLYGCETWSLTFRKKRRMRFFENRVLRRICGPKRDEVKWELKNYIMKT